MLKSLLGRLKKDDSIEVKLSNLVKARETALSVFTNIKKSLMKTNEELRQVQEVATQKANHYLIIAGNAQKSINEHDKLIKRVEDFLS